MAPPPTAGHLRLPRWTIARRLPTLQPIGDVGVPTMRLEFPEPPTHKRSAFPSEAPETRPGYLQTHRRGRRKLSLCTAAHPLHTRFAQRIGASFVEATVRAIPKRIDGSGFVCGTGVRVSPRRTERRIAPPRRGTRRPRSAQNTATGGPRGPARGRRWQGRAAGRGSQAPRRRPVVKRLLESNHRTDFPIRLLVPNRAATDGDRPAARPGSRRRPRAGGSRRRALHHPDREPPV
jgi:hypothetical protein